MADQDTHASEAVTVDEGQSADVAAQPVEQPPEEDQPAAASSGGGEEQLPSDQQPATADTDTHEEEDTPEVETEATDASEQSEQMAEVAAEESSSEVAPLQQPEEEAPSVEAEISQAEEAAPAEVEEDEDEENEAAPDVPPLVVAVDEPVQEASVDAQPQPQAEPSEQPQQPSSQSRQPASPPRLPQKSSSGSPLPPLSPVPYHPSVPPTASGAGGAGGDSSFWDLFSSSAPTAKVSRELLEWVPDLIHNPPPTAMLAADWVKAAADLAAADERACHAHSAATLRFGFIDELGEYHAQLEWPSENAVASKKRENKHTQRARESAKEILSSIHLQRTGGRRAPPQGRAANPADLPDAQWWLLSSAGGDGI